MILKPLKYYLCDCYKGFEPNVVLVLRLFKRYFHDEDRVVEMVEHIQVGPTRLRRTTIERVEYFVQVYRPISKLKRILYCED